MQQTSRVVILLGVTQLTIVLVLIALAFLRFGIVVLGAAMIIRPAKRCPACFRDTLAIRRRWLERVSSRYEWRWCPECQWQGVGLKVEKGDWVNGGTGERGNGGTGERGNG